MTIRFHCPFCEQLLGISGQKAGAVVECPTCHGKVGVPRPDAPPTPAPHFRPPRPAPRGLVLGWGEVVGLGLALLLLAGMAFVAGLLVGALS
jgi:hypothetical protein